MAFAEGPFLLKARYKNSIGRLQGEQMRINLEAFQGAKTRLHQRHKLLRLRTLPRLSKMLYANIIIVCGFRNDSSVFSLINYLRQVSRKRAKYKNNKTE